MFLSCTPETYDAARERLVLLSEVGSVVHGLNQPGVSDRDLMGVTVMPPEDVLGLNPFETLVWRSVDGPSTRSGADDEEMSVHSLKKFLSLCANGNPSILMLLFAPPSMLEQVTETGLDLRERRDLFVTKSAGRRFLGYMTAQRKRMIDSTAGVRSPRTNRPELIAEYGYDTKFAMHMLRLGMQGFELMTTGEIEAPMSPENISLLMGVRNGYAFYDDILKQAEHLESKLERAIKQADVPDKVDWDAVSEFSSLLHFQAWDEAASIA